MKIKLHTVNIVKGSKNILEWFSGLTVKTVEKTNFSHGFFELVDASGQSYFVDNILTSRIQVVSLLQLSKCYTKVEIWERDLSQQEYIECDKLLKSFVGAYYSPWKVLTLKPRQWFVVPGNLSGLIFPEIVANVLNKIYGKHTVPELTGVKELLGLLGNEWKKTNENFDT